MLQPDTVPVLAPSSGRQAGARAALLTLSAINVLSFADRYVASSVKKPIQDELRLSDTETAMPVTGCMLVYMIFAPIFGTIHDKGLVDRRVLLAGAIGLWSAATALAGFAQDLTQLVFFRSLVGVGEAAFVSIAPPMISDFYPMRDRNMAYTIFTIAMPVGGALGFGAGALLAQIFNWRVSFFVCGIPGLATAGLALLLNDPPRGINDASESAVSPSTPLSRTASGGDVRKQERTATQDVLRLLQNKHYLVATSGMIASNFAVGALADWFDTYLVRAANASLGEAGLTLAAATLVGGIGGTPMGAIIAQKYDLRVKNAYFLVPSLLMLPAAAFMFGAVNLVPNKFVVYICIVLGEIFFFSTGPPLTTMSISAVPADLRARSSGLQVLLVHILGDVMSPPLIGAISDHTGSLQVAMQLCWMALLLASLCWWCGARFLDRLPAGPGGDGCADTAAEGFCDKAAGKSEPSLWSLLREGEHSVVDNPRIELEEWRSLATAP